MLDLGDEVTVQRSINSLFLGTNVSLVVVTIGLNGAKNE